ncbi:MAG TPA: hypothetical protein VMC85_04485 [Desulfomonilaceae bacterium]|nr:hypothetical protein [Desulfomonilaceae bacterium]
MSKIGQVKTNNHLCVSKVSAFSAALLLQRFARNRYNVNPYDGLKNDVMGVQ